MFEPLVERGFSDTKLVKFPSWAFYLSISFTCIDFSPTLLAPGRPRCFIYHWPHLWTATFQELCVLCNKTILFIPPRSAVVSAR